MKKNIKIITIISIVALILILLAWAPWLNNNAVHDNVFKERAHKDGTAGEVINTDGTKEIKMICDYNVHWFPFGRWVASCEGGYFVTFWGRILI